MNELTLHNGLAPSGIRDLSIDEIEQINGAFLANLGMGIVGSAAGMATYAISGLTSGSLSGSGFAGAAAGGFVFGAGGFNSVSGYAGAAVGGAVSSYFGA
jgi:hypothetical protein